MNEIIQVKNLTKDYGSGRGVFDVSFSVKSGEVFGFLGPNGAGKSTTIRHLMGFSKPQCGQTLIFGKPTFDKYNEILQHVGYIPGEIALPQGLTGEEFLKMMQSLQGTKDDERLKEMRDLFELSDSDIKIDSKHLSLGVKRKLAVVAAFMHDPEVLILDEPTSGLDPVMQEVFVEFIHKEKSRGKTILLSSHIFTEIDSTCDRIAIIKDGRIVSQFIAVDLKHASKKFYTVGFSTDKNLNEFVEKAKEINSFSFIEVKKGEAGENESEDDYKNGAAFGGAALSGEKGKSKLYMSLDDGDINMAVKLLSECGATEFSSRRESLEDYFMKFYKEEKDFGGAFK